MDNQHIPTSTESIVHNTIIALPNYANLEERLHLFTSERLEVPELISFNIETGTWEEGGGWLFKMYVLDAQIIIDFENRWSELEVTEMLQIFEEVSTSKLIPYEEITGLPEITDLVFYLINKIGAHDVLVSEKILYTLCFLFYKNNYPLDPYALYSLINYFLELARPASDVEEMVFDSQNEELNEKPETLNLQKKTILLLQIILEQFRDSNGTINLETSLQDLAHSAHNEGLIYSSELERELNEAELPSEVISMFKQALLTPKASL